MKMTNLKHVSVYASLTLLGTNIKAEVALKASKDNPENLEDLAAIKDDAKMVVEENFEEDDIPMSDHGKYCMIMHPSIE